MQKLFHIIAARRRGGVLLWVWAAFLVSFPLSPVVASVLPYSVVASGRVLNSLQAVAVADDGTIYSFNSTHVFTVAMAASTATPFPIAHGLQSADTLLIGDGRAGIGNNLILAGFHGKS